MQAAFFQLSDIISIETAISSLKKSAVKNYGHQGKAVVDSHFNAIDKAISGLIKIDVPEEWGSCDTAAPSRFESVDAPALTEKVMFPIMELKGAQFKVTDFLDKHQCFLPRLWEQLNTKRDALPHWLLHGIARNASNSTDSLSAIRLYLFDKSNEGQYLISIPSREPEGYNFDICTAPYDCMGCKVCVNRCPTLWNRTHDLIKS